MTKSPSKTPLQRRWPATFGSTGMRARVGECMGWRRYSVVLHGSCMRPSEATKAATPESSRERQAARRSTSARPLRHPGTAPRLDRSAEATRPREVHRRRSGQACLRRCQSHRVDCPCRSMASATMLLVQYIL
jgi:hypothetical protein